MTTGKKTALSLLISVIIFSLSAIFLYSGVFEKIETRFYQPAVINGIVESLNTVEKSLDEYHRMNFLRFGDFLSKESVKVSFLPNPGQKAITEINGFTGKLFEQNPGLKGIRFIDFQGRGVHYSTYKNDILATNKNVTAFKNYDQLDTNVRYQEISQEENSTGELFLDESKEEILYLLPFIDNYNAYQGTAVFYVSVRDLENFLVTRNLIKQGESLILFNSKENNLKGLVKSLSVIGKKLVLEIQNLDGIGIPGNTSFADENGNSYMLLTVKNSPYEIFTGEIANDELFLFPDSAKNLLLVTIVITVFLAFFLLFNVRQDSYSIIHQRVIELEKEIIREYINHRDNLTWDKLLDEMEMKKGAVSREIKKALGTGWKKHGALIDDYFNESWEELISVLWEKKENSANQESINEIKKMLEEILSKGAVFKSQEPSFREKPENLVSLPAEPDKTGEEVLEELPEAGEQEPVTLSEQAEQEKTGVEPRVEPLEEPLEELPEAGEQEPATLSEQAEPDKTGEEPLEELPEAGEQEPVTLSEQAEQEKTGVEPREEPLEEPLEELPEAGEQEPATLSEQAEPEKTGVEPLEETLEELPEAGEQEPATLSEQAEPEKTGVEPLEEPLEELPEAEEQEPATLSEQAEQEKTGVEPLEELPEAGEQEPVTLSEQAEQDKTGVEPLEETLEELPEAGEQEPATLSEQAEPEKNGVEPLEETLEELPEAGEQEPVTLSEQAEPEKTGVEPRVEPLEETLEELPEAGEQEPEERRKPLSETLRDLDEIPSLSTEKKEPVPEVNVILDIGNINFSQLDNIKNTLVPEKTESYDTKENMNDNENGRAYIEDSEIPEVQEIFPDNKSWSFWLNSVGDFPDLSAPLYGETEELEVVGDGEEFAELLEINESESIQEDSNMEKTEEETNIILKDGVYQINPVENKPGMKINEDFLNLVNSIMKKSPL